MGDLGEHLGQLGALPVGDVLEAHRVEVAAARALADADEAKGDAAHLKLQLDPHLDRDHDALGGFKAAAAEAEVDEAARDSSGAGERHDLDGAIDGVAHVRAPIGPLKSGPLKRGRDFRLRSGVNLFRLRMDVSRHSRALPRWRRRAMAAGMNLNPGGTLSRGRG